MIFIHITLSCKLLISGVRIGRTSGGSIGLPRIWIGRHWVGNLSITRGVGWLAEAPFLFSFFPAGLFLVLFFGFKHAGVPPVAIA